MERRSASQSCVATRHQGASWSRQPRPLGLPLNPLECEFFGWRALKHRREVGGLAGLTPTPYQSGASAREQGITKAGNRHVRWMTTELAWSWVRYQPESALSCLFRERFGGGGKRLRRIGIVAVARKLLIALWRFLETGVLPEEAALKE